MQTPNSGSYDHETIILMRAALDKAWDSLSPSEQARMTQSLLAERILRAAKRGERDPLRLRASALIGPVTLVAAE